MPDPTPRLNAALEGRYAIEAKVGEGGMATVYLADDLKHERKVALKVLKPELAAVVGAERFLAEIKTTANLQHPHILPLFDSGEAGGFLYYVMPFVEGESLRHRIDREGQLPVDEAVSIARAVADALDYAHRHDVIHRDIKPENILLHEGNPVVADFGIALAVQQAGGGRLTETGLSLGTPYYMSPEQATADRDPGPRSDVYSLASVLYEMLTGEPPHTGSSAQAILGKILTSDPVRPTELRRSVPAHVEAVILRCLEKLPADRLSSAAEFAEALTKPGAVDLGGYGAAAAPVVARPMAWLPWTIAGAAATALAVVLLGRTSPAPTSGAVTVRAVLELPADAYLFFPQISITPDGRRLAVHASVNGRRTVLVRDLDELEFRRLAETDVGALGGAMGFISYDGRWVVFRSGDGLRKAPVAGGPSVMMDADAHWAGGHWTSSDTIYYSRNYRSGVWRIPAEGGEPEPLTVPDDEAGDLAHWWPQLLPDRKHVLFTTFRTPIDRAEITVVSLETREQRRLLTGGVHGRYVSTGHLLYVREEALLAVPFDLDRLEVTGDPVTVVDDVAMQHVDGLGGYTVSETGTLVYVPASDFNALGDLVFVDREGSETEILPEPGLYKDPALSPDGRRIALSIAEPGEPGDIFVLDLVRGTRSRITAGGGDDFGPRWTPDGDQVIYVSESPVFDLFIRPADASRPASAFVTDRFDKYPVSFTPDGRNLIYTQAALPRSRAMSVSLEGGAPDTVFAPGFGASEATLSPDGRWLAYSSTESGRSEVFLSSYPDPSLRRQQISPDGGVTPLWTRGGREVVFRSGNRVMAVAVDRETGDLGRPEVLFAGPYQHSDNALGYDVSADGERFVFVKRPLERAPRRLIVVTNWFEELKELVGN